MPPSWAPSAAMARRPFIATSQRLLAWSHVRPSRVDGYDAETDGAATGAAAAFAPAVGRRAGGGALGDRGESWPAAARQFKAHPIVGAGPEHELVLPGTPSERAAGVTRISRFAHNEYLQVASGAGIVGMALLALLLATIGRAVTGSDPASAAVRAALVVLAVGALFDFAWHLPALGITAGWIASLSGRRS